MRKRSWFSVGLAMVLAVIFMFTNIGCGGDSAPTDPNAVTAAVEAPLPVIS